MRGTRRSGSGLAARSTRSISTRRMPGTSARGRHPSLSMLVRLDEDSVAGRRELHQLASAAATSGRGRKLTVFRSATAGACQRASPNSMRPLPGGRAVRPVIPPVFVAGVRGRDRAAVDEVHWAYLLVPRLGDGPA